MQNQTVICERRTLINSFGKIPFSALTINHIVKLQTTLRAKKQANGKHYKANSINGFIGGALRAMLKDARRTGALTVNLFDRDLFDPLPLTDTENSIDPYEPEERELILEGFRLKRPQFYAFVYHQFWTGCRPSEACYLRMRSVDLRYGWERIEGSLVQGEEDGTKTKRSNRQMKLPEHLVAVLSEHLKADPAAEWIATAAADHDGYVFTTPTGIPIDEQNFYNREWKPMLRRLKIRPRPFYNTRHIPVLCSPAAIGRFSCRNRPVIRARLSNRITPNICPKWTPDMTLSKPRSG